MPANSHRGKSIADRNREIRQEEHRTKISESNQLGHVLNLADKIHELAHATADVTDVTDGDTDVTESNTKPIPISGQIKNLEVAFNARMKLLNKILPDMKALELDVSATLDVLEIDRTGIHDDEDEDDEPDTD